MIGWAIFGTYMAGFVVAARLIASAFLRADFDPDDATDRICARALGCMIGLTWPLILAGVLITGRLPKTDKQIRAELEARDRRISELERELGMPRS